MAKYSKGAQKGVESAMKRMEKGKLRSGKSNKKVTNPKQAIAIGLSEAKEKGAKVPPPPKKAAAKKATPEKKETPKKTVKKATSKKAAKNSNPVKAGSKKTAPVKASETGKKASKKSKKTTGQAQDEVTNKEAITNDNTSKQQSPVEEKSPSINTFRNADPFTAVDKKLVSKFTTKGDPKHNMPISSVSKSGLKPSGKKPLWN